MNTMLTGNRRLALRSLAVQVPRILAVLAALTGGVPSLDAASAGAFEAVTVAGPTIVPAEFNGDLSKPPLLPSAVGEAPRYLPPLRLPKSTKLPIGFASASPVPQPFGGPLAPMPSPSQNFAGMSYSDACVGGQCGWGWPPDANGDVGPNHYIEAVQQGYAIYSKTGTLLAAFTEQQLWSGTGAPHCDGEPYGDPVVLYDRIADRWILTHRAFGLDFFGTPQSPYYQCIAASKTSDPVAGGWWLYAIRTDPGAAGSPPAGNLSDQGKFGMWHDCLYWGANEFMFPGGSYSGAAYGSFSRSDLYSGAPLTYALGFIAYSLPANGVGSLYPSNNLGNGANAVLPGTSNYFVQESFTNFAFEVRKFTPGANCGNGGTMSAATLVSQTAYPAVPANFDAVVPQPGTGNKLYNLDDRIMQKVQYRRIGSTESVWVTHNVDTATGMTAMQWAQIDVTGGTIATTPVQQQIYTPDMTLWRWMGSLAVDGQGNMALGYSTSNDTAPNYPSIAYSGRLATDLLGTLPRTEVQLVAGAGPQNNTSLWGWYSAMSVDPVDDCTFWYTNEYYSSAANGASGNWQTRIGSFKFPTCSTPTTRVLVPDGTSEQQTFTAYPETRWFAMTVEPGKTYVIDAVDPSGDLTANAIGTLNVFAPDGISASPEASVDCAGGNGPRPPAVTVASDGIRCVLRTALPTAGMQQNKRPVFIKVTRFDPAIGGGAQFKIRARESTIYGRWLTNGYDYHVEVENTTADAMCVEVVRYPASGLTYTAGPGWAGSLASFTLTVPPFGAVKQVIPKGGAVGADTEGTLRITACAAPTNLMASGLHVNTYGFDPVTNRYIYFFTGTANDGKTRSTW